MSIHDVYSRYFQVWRKKRFLLFSRHLSPSRSDRLLDVGGTPGFWLANPPVVGSIDSVNVEAMAWDPAAFPEYHIRSLQGDGCRLALPDGSYDIAFSNSVIEHVGSWENQVAFAREIRRVGKGLWVQTPARECPIEPHYLAPFIHWFPKSLQRRLIRYFTPRGWIERLTRKQVDEMVDSIRLLNRAEMKLLFPDCEILVERALGFLPKSYIAVRKKR